ncbi:hypothetical protein ACFY7H_33710 [Streptomyces sp. NPDC012794]|uniref:hypothetical protein n=1 Tax=Streptomyces sp. NPDC012794 TaxID=3364850 RepID=UPI00367EFC8A
MDDDVILRKVGPEGCAWCGEPVSQLGTRTPRLYCQRSHRQRALEARRLGLPMKKDRPPKGTAPAPVPPARREEMQAALFLAEAVERTSVDVPAATESAGDFLLAPPDRVVVSGTVLPPTPSREAIEAELARRVAWIEGLDADGQ